MIRDGFRPRVLQICAVDFTVRHFVAPVAEFLTTRGCKVDIACTRGPLFDGLIADGYRMIDLPIARSMNVARHFGSYRRVLAHLRRERYDVVHVHTPVASFIVRQAAARARVPHCFYSAHGFYFHEGMSASKRRLHVALERHFARKCEHIFTVSNEDRQTAIDERIAPPVKLTYIGQGVDVGRFDPAQFSAEERKAAREEFGIPPDAVLAVMTGRLVREKGWFEFIEAAGMLKAQARGESNLYCLAIGDALPSDYDDSKAQMQAAVAQAGLNDTFIFAGLRSDVPRLLAAADLFVLPSYREGMPVSILEAMSMGLPCIVTDIRGSREEVIDGACGRIVPPRQAAPLAAALGVLTSDATMRQRFGQAARQRVLDHFRREQYFERQWEVYKQKLGI
ncbi:glycosyltransferase family 4 protein [Candidatus Sumerlaeota bacterium]|nr:glycosyltransferase family 4 protein [Candidatus Sumerlaeota bacterium]